ncbi:peptidoglycan-binding protein [Luteipulveratus mongoliensis]|uniref:Peptidoglycan-binding protein n=1 Tax=Luteipulveratus mongoliensis TaxID=571913 RepID=A0A0K1JPH2_9MICO|nr:peptidoglycan-binding protein [Luteipulveratus mongoliensis]
MLTTAGISTALLAGGIGVASQQADAAKGTSVNMEAVVKAAQWDPYKSDQSMTPGAKDSVKAVESALAAKGLLSKKYVDGHYGTTTVTAYAKFQKSLGYSGLDATGLPGKGSLTQLGKGRYSLDHTISVGGKTTMDGKTVNTRTAAMVKAAEKKGGLNLVLTQGEYNPGGVDASAGTHDGGGAIDISVNNLNSRSAAVKALRQVGFAAWERTPAQGFDPHIHAVAISDTDMAPGAQAQIGDYYKGLNGLAGHGEDNGPKVKKVTFEEYQRG